MESTVKIVYEPNYEDYRHFKYVLANDGTILLRSSNPYIFKEKKSYRFHRLFNSWISLNVDFLIGLVPEYYLPAFVFLLCIAGLFIKLTNELFPSLVFAVFSLAAVYLCWKFNRQFIADAFEVEGTITTVGYDRLHDGDLYYIFDVVFNVNSTIVTAVFPSKAYWTRPKPGEQVKLMVDKKHPTYIKEKAPFNFHYTEFIIALVTLFFSIIMLLDSCKLITSGVSDSIY